MASNAEPAALAAENALAADPIGTDLKRAPQEKVELAPMASPEPPISAVAPTPATATETVSPPKPAAAASSAAHAVTAAKESSKGSVPAPTLAAAVTTPAVSPSAGNGGNLRPTSAPTTNVIASVPDVIVADTHLVAGAPPLNLEHISEVLPDAEAERRIRAMSRRSFLWGAGAVAAAYFGIQWLGTRRQVAGVQWPFRRLLEVNEGLSRDLFSEARLAPEFPKSIAKMPRANGDFGVAAEIDPNWKLQLVGLKDMSKAEMPEAAVEPDAANTDEAEPAPDKKQGPPDKKQGAHPDKKISKQPTIPPAGQENSGQDESDDTSDSSDSSDSSDTSDTADASTEMEPAVMVTMEEIKKLPRTEMVTELKCIEGWSTIVHWAGVRLVDFLTKYPPATKSGKPFDPKHLDDLPEYVSMETPDKAYYVALDMASALHPQTILCYEMNGQSLPAEHGAPLRLAIPVKYGIKNIKNIGKIKFTDERPKDYWAEQGYDWYAGH